jgi:phosphatidylethanolamine-binding protein (PEBP) family uncharacterized protein
MKRISVAMLLSGLLLASAEVLAHPGHDHDDGERVELRPWKRADGSYLGGASFVAATGEQVVLRGVDGSPMRVKLRDLSDYDRDWVRERVAEIKAINEIVALAPEGDKAAPTIAKDFEAFKDKVKLRWDEKFLYVESDGFPDHPMMKGIKAWQQQVPLPQSYTGKNAWQIPLKPVLAEKPISAKNAFFRGAIALAVNGVPIFNALNNRGEDSYLIGELDEYGGHCGRADDYHYHFAPVHLEKKAGKGNPIGYGLDGFPLYGYTDAGGKEPKDLDEFNGRMEKDGYRYYSTKKYPYINGGMRGVVTVRGDQVDPQPRAGPVRTSLTALRGATIPTELVRDDVKKTYKLNYDVNGQARSITYTINSDGTYTFVFKDSNGKETTESYRRRELKDDGPKKDKKDGPRKKEGKDRPPKKDDNDSPPPKKDDGPKRDEPSTIQPRKTDGFTLTSPAFEHGGDFPAEHTGAGTGISPPLAWARAPERTKCFALHLWHIPPKGEEIKSYWVVYNIPANITSLPKGAKGIGKDGYNGKGRTGYDPMNSKGPGVKEYHITIYALSAEPKFNSDKVTRADLLAAIKEITLAESTLSYTYERSPKKEEK